MRKLPGFTLSRYRFDLPDSPEPSGWLDEFGAPNSNGAFDSAHLPEARFYYRKGDEAAISRTVVAVEPGCDGCVGRRERCLWTPYRYNCNRATIARTKSLRTVDGVLINMRTGEAEGVASWSMWTGYCCQIFPALSALEVSRSQSRGIVRS
jgi:hypothetical protein